MIVVDLILNELQNETQETKELIFMDDPYAYGRVDGLTRAIEVIGGYKEEFDKWRNVFKKFLNMGHSIEDAEKLSDSSFIIQ